MKTWILPVWRMYDLLNVCVRFDWTSTSKLAGRSQSGSIPPDDPPFYADGGDPDEELYDEPRQRPLARAPVYDPDGPGPGSG